jgi:hypothetical protein
MTPEAQRIVIAEACGYRRKEPNWNRWLKPDGQYEAYGIAGLPDYLSDLNAIHEAEKVLEELNKTYNLQTEIPLTLKYGNLLVVATNMTNPYHATAAQRAGLRTLGKWVEE